MLMSCATDAGWEVNDVPFKEQPWRICTEEIDGAELHLKGYCYWQEQTKKRFLKSAQWRRVQKVCLFSDKVCQLKFAQSGKRLR